MDRNIRVDVDESNETVGKKIRNAEKQKVPYMIVIGDKENDLSALSVRTRGLRDTDMIGTTDFIAKITAEITERM